MAYTTSKNGIVFCSLCPHHCAIRDGSTGVCRVRKNVNGTLTLPLYGMLSSIALDPIEKKPLYHFHPGEQILSVGFYGCNFRCPFCQNYTISQHVAQHATVVQPEELVDLAEERRSFAIAYTYSEPLVHFEYVLESARIARSRGIKNVLVTNGFIEDDPANELFRYIDAANIDIKAFTDEFYRDEIKGDLEPVKRIIQLAAKTLHVEATTLVIPGKNDSDEEIGAIAEFLSEISPDIPLHLSAYYPTYTYTIEATTPQTIRRLTAIAEEQLRFVYPGNIPGGADTRCPACNSLVIKRSGYSVQTPGMTDGYCSSCGEPLSIVQ